MICITSPNKNPPSTSLTSICYSKTFHEIGPHDLAGLQFLYCFEQFIKEIGTSHFIHVYIEFTSNVDYFVTSFCSTYFDITNSTLSTLSAFCNICFPAPIPRILSQWPYVCILHDQVASLREDMVYFP